MFLLRLCFWWCNSTVLFLLIGNWVPRRKKNEEFVKKKKRQNLKSYGRWSRGLFFLPVFTPSYASMALSLKSNCHRPIHLEQHSKSLCTVIAATAFFFMNFHPKPVVTATPTERAIMKSDWAPTLATRLFLHRSLSVLLFIVSVFNAPLFFHLVHHVVLRRRFFVVLFGDSSPWKSMGPWDTKPRALNLIHLSPTENWENLSISS